MAQRPEFVCGDRVGPWFISEKVGSGNFGNVYICINSMGIMSALKIMDNRYVARQESSMMHQLIGIAAVPQFFNCWFENNLSHIAMEIVGPSLWDFRLMSSESRFDMQTLQKLAYQSITALEQIHQRGIIHGDLMAPNVCISHPPNQNGEVIIKIIDFGSSWNYQTGEQMAIRWNQDKKASPFLRGEEGPVQTDDLNQWLYMVLYLAGHQLNEIFLANSLEEGNAFKIELVTDPRSILDEKYSWMFYLMKLVGYQSTQRSINYSDVLEAVEWFGPTNHTREAITMTHVNGVPTIL